MAEKINVLIADDSFFMRCLTADILKKADNRFNVVDFARDGKEAAEKCFLHKPDVVLMDMIMGEYDGVMGVKLIMEKCPTPIIILSSLVQTDMEPILQSLKLGAVDYHHKPDRTNNTVFENDAALIEKIIVASKSSVKECTENIKETCEIQHQHTFSDNINYDVIVIGSSTGGPTAIETVITKLPKNLSVPVIIAQHMPENFVPSFAARLNNLTPLTITMAKKDDVLEPGKIFIAPGSRNLVLKYREDGKVVCDFSSKRFKEYNFPSINGLMLSVAEIYGARAIGVILTGMGKDGAEGLKKIKEKGGYTVGQSPETCVVYGMPREAFEIGAVTQVVPLNEIAHFIVSCLE